MAPPTVGSRPGGGGWVRIYTTIPVRSPRSPPHPRCPSSSASSRGCCRWRPSSLGPWCSDSTPPPGSGALQVIGASPGGPWAYALGGRNSNLAKLRLILAASPNCAPTLQIRPCRCPTILVATFVVNRSWSPGVSSKGSVDSDVVLAMLRACDGCC
jgi:hypothetical protein